MLTKFVAGLLIGSSFLFFPGREPEHQVAQKSEIRGISTVNEVSDVLSAAPELANVLETPVLKARAALAYDLHSGSILYTSNYDERLPVASLTKLVTALVVADKLKLDDVVTVQEQDIKIVGVNMGLLPGERIKVIDLLRGMLIPSSNDAAKTLARAAGGTERQFVDLMNLKVKSLGLESTHFDNPVGLDSTENYSTAHDISRIIEEFLKNENLAATVQVRETEVTSVDKRYKHRLRSTNKLLLENSNVLGIKTGFTTLAKGSLVTRVKQNESEIITIVISSDNREEDTQKLIDWVLGVYKW